MSRYDLTFHLKLNVNHWPIFHGPVILLFILKNIWWTAYFGIMSRYDPAFDLKINVGHCDLYLMVQWFCLLTWRIVDVWTSYCWIMSQYYPTFDLKINVGHCVLLCPWARHFTPRKYWLITQEAMAPSRHDWKIVDWDVKPQHNQPTVSYISWSSDFA